MIEKLTKDLINKIIVEIKKDENKLKIKNDILNPLLCEFSNKIYPYINILFVMYIINIFLIIIVLFLVVLKKKK